MAQMTCPRCGSEKTRFIEKADIYLCKNCDYEFCPSGESAIVPDAAAVSAAPDKRLRIFLSYGHDRNEEPVLKIKDDLEAIGHDVWIDKEEIKFGDDWRRSITDGISGSNLMLSFLSKHSTRDPGVCLDELSIALGTNSGIVQTILVESEKEVSPPVSVSHVQWLDMHDWKNHWDEDAKSPVSDRWYDGKLAEILKVVESDASYRFSGEIEELKKKLLPVTSDVRIGWLLKKGFEGRKWLLEEINDWLKRNTDSRVFFLTGKPGVGKSAFAAWLAHQNKSNIIAAHFIEYNKPDRKDPRRIILSIAFQIAARLPDYRKFLMGLPELDRLGEKKAAELFRYLLVEPLNQAIEGGRERYAVIIDALDEAADEPGNSIVDIIAQETDLLPKWVTFIITSRPNPDIMRRLSGLAPMELAADDERNRQDLSDYFRKWIDNRKLTLPNPEEAVSGIVSASEGIFLYLQKFREWVENHGWIDVTDSTTYPKGMTGMYQLYFKRQFPDIEAYEKYQVPLLELIAVACEPLPAALAEKALNWKGRDKIKVLDPLGSLFQKQDGRITPFHKSVKDWLVNPDDAGNYFIAVEDGHRKLADHGWRQYEQNVETMDAYHMAWLPSHLAETGKYENLVTLLKDFDYMMARLKAGMLERLLENYRELTKEIPLTTRKDLRYEEAFYRERAHILRRANDEWPAHKILLQLAIEHADDSPLTIGAEKFLADGKCDWLWLRREMRMAHIGSEPFVDYFERHTKAVEGAIVLSNRLILSWSRDKTLRLWDNNGKPVAIFHGHTDFVNGAMLLPDGRILSWSRDRTLRLWDNDGKPLAVMEGHTGWVDGVLELSNGQLLSWAWDNTMRLWGRNGQLCAILDGHTDLVNGVCELSDDRLLSWSNDKTLRLWNNNGNIVSVLEGHTHRVDGALELSDGLLLSWAWDNTLRLWDKEGKPLKVFLGHTNWVKGAMELHDGLTLSWSDDGDIRLWNRDGSPRMVLCYGLHRDDLDFCDKSILSWVTDKRILIWEQNNSVPKMIMKNRSSSLTRAIAYFNDKNIIAWSEDIIFKYDVFISYWYGNKDLADSLCSILESNNVSVCHELTNFTCVNNLSEEICNAITQSRFIILVLSERANQSTAVDEIEFACSKGKNIIMFRVEDTFPYGFPMHLSLNQWYDACQGQMLEHMKRFAAIFKEKFLYRNDAPMNTTAIRVLKLPQNADEMENLKYAKENVFYWYANDICRTYIIGEDGTVVVTQATGQIYFLKLYYSNCRLSICDIEQIISKDVDNQSKNSSPRQC